MSTSVASKTWSKTNRAAFRSKPRLAGRFLLAVLLLVAAAWLLRAPTDAVRPPAVSAWLGSTAASHQTRPLRDWGRRSAPTPATPRQTQPTHTAPEPREPQRTALLLQDNDPLTNAAPSNQPAGADTSSQPQRAYLGFRSCLRCHNSGISGVSVPLPGGGTLNLADNQWVLYREYPIWQAKDKHGQAYTVLLNDRSRRMGEILGVREINRDRRCLACHTGYPIDQMPTDDKGLVSKELSQSLDVNLGVSCEGCHGPAGDVQQNGRVVTAGWMSLHQIQPVMPYEQTKPWRFLSPQTKRDKFGFYDVRSPASKARLCASCHVGSVKEGRVVTHEMYAAGHPPLPGFEIETFIAQMPKHWRTLSEKAEQVRAEFLKHTQDPLYRQTEFSIQNLSRTNSLLVGALVSLSESLKLTAQLADDTASGPVTKPEWPELAQFDCFACHHELQEPAWRRMRKPPVGTPGRPPFREWTTVLAQLAVRTAGASLAEVPNDARLDARMTPLRQTMSVQPFGVRSELVTRASAAAEWANSLAEELQRKPLTPDDGRAVLRDIAELATSQLSDYDSARQLVWAFRIIHDELKGQGAPLDDEITQRLAAFDDMFLLDLRTGRKSATLIPGEQQARTVLEVDLSRTLPPIAHYDPHRFQQQFRKLAELLSKQ